MSHPCDDGHDWWTPNGRPNAVKLVPATASWLKPSASYLRPVEVAHTWACRRCGLRRRGSFGAGPVDIVFAGYGPADRAEAQRIFREHREAVAR